MGSDGRPVAARQRGIQHRLADHVTVLDEALTSLPERTGPSARINRGARNTYLRIDATWRWAAVITASWHRLWTAFT